jgi:hypothetical protein
MLWAGIIYREKHRNGTLDRCLHTQHGVFVWKVGWGQYPRRLPLCEIIFFQKWKGWQVDKEIQFISTSSSLAGEVLKFWVHSSRKFLIHSSRTWGRTFDCKTHNVSVFMSYSLTQLCTLWAQLWILNVQLWIVNIPNHPTATYPLQRATTRSWALGTHRYLLPPPRLSARQPPLHPGIFEEVLY